MIFHNRAEAGRLLAKKLAHYQDDPKGIVLGLPRGGVVTAFEVAQILHLPLDIIVVRKIGAPGNPELAIGAIDANGEGVFEENTIQAFQVQEEYLKTEKEKEKKEAKRRLECYRGKRPPISLNKKNVILVDDGIATGLSMLAAINAVRKQSPKKLIVAVPVIARDTAKNLQAATDELISISTPTLFMAVGAFYEDFSQTSDEEVITLLRESEESFREKV